MSIRGSLITCATVALAVLFAATAAAQGTIVTCESQNYRNTECPVAGGPVAFLRQLSTPPGDCIEGRTWGFNGYNNTIWVTNGCRAEFRVGYGAYPAPRPAPGTTVICESQDYRNAECAVPGGPVALVRQLSTPPGDCIEGRTWGFNGYNNTIWVTNGCRAEFVAGSGGAYQPPRPAPEVTVFCESQNYRNAECPIPGGPVALVRQLSTPPGDCIEGRTWGYNGNNNTIWVTNGCRGEFRAGGGYVPR
jgi:hypothetical protein